MNLPAKLIDSAKKIYTSVRVAKVHPTLVWGARILILIMLTPIILATMTYAISFYVGEISSANDKIITMGSLTGLIWLSVDRNGDGIPDKLEEEPKLPQLQNMTERSDKNEKRI